MKISAKKHELRLTELPLFVTIDWRIPTGKALLSDKDRKHKPLAEADGLFDYNEKLY